MDILSLLAMITSFISIASVIYLGGIKWGKLEERLNAIEKHGCGRIQEVEKSVSKLQTQMQPFWAIVETQIAQSLHHDDTPEYDRLLIKFSNHMSRAELLRLKCLLESDYAQSTSNGDRWRTLSVALVLTRVLARQQELENSGRESE